MDRVDGAGKPERAGSGLRLGSQRNDRDAELLGRAKRGRLAARFDDQRLGFEILEVELELVLLISGIERRRRRGGGHAQKRRRHLGSVRQYDRDPIAAADSEIVQRPDGAIDQRTQARIAQRRRAVRGDGDRVITTRCDEGSQSAIRAHAFSKCAHSRVSDSPRPLRATVSPKSFVTA